MPVTECQSSALKGRKWKAVINGKRSLNGQRHSVTLLGTIDSADGCSTIYDVMHALAEHCETINREMGHPDSFQVTLYPPSTEGGDE